MTFWETIVSGEYVMFALAAILIAVVVIWWARTAWLLSLRKRNIALMHRIRDYVVEGDIENSISLCSGTNLPGARVVESGLKMIGSTLPEIKKAMDHEQSRQQYSLRRGNIWLKALAIIAPLAGCAGTLAGACHHLHQLALSPEGTDPAAACGAIAPTIITTIAGLGVGIIAIIAGTSLEAMGRKAEDEICDLEDELIDILNTPV